MNKKNLLIINHLRNNARETLTNLSKKTGIPISTIYENLKRNEVIVKHTCLLDFTKLGFNTRAKILFKVNKESRGALQEYLEKHQNMNNVYKINNGYDYLVESLFKNIKDLQDFIEIVEEKYPIEEKEVYYVIEEVKREAFMSNQETLKLFGNKS